MVGSSSWVVDDLSWAWLSSAPISAGLSHPAVVSPMQFWPSWVSSVLHGYHPLYTSRLARTCYHVLYFGRDMRAGLIEQALFKYLLMSHLLTYCPKHVTGLSPKSGVMKEVWVFSTTCGKGLLESRLQKGVLAFFHN